MFRLFKKRKKYENTSFERDITHNIITYTIKFENMEYIKEWFDPKDIAYINYNTYGKYFIAAIKIK